MAKIPKKTQDPTQAALSAIEEALQISEQTPEKEASFEERQPAREPSPPRDAAPPQEAPSSPEARPSREAVPPREAPPPPPTAIVDEPPLPRRRPPPPPPRRVERIAQRAANDDRQTVGQILQVLHRRPSRMPYLIGGAAAVWWIAMALFIGYSRAREDIAAAANLLEIVDLPYFWTYFATLVLPPAAFLMFATLVRRTQEMRSVSRAMTEVTLRLAEPDGIPTDAIVSVGQAIRREVAALGDGIERAIARASELEAMVRNEVATLERAYDENEIRVRSLVDELQSERDAIVSHATRLREAIAGAHENFNLDVEEVASRINTTVNAATERMSDTLGAATDRMSHTLGGATERMSDTLGTATEHINNTLGAATDRINTTLSATTEQINATLDEATNRVTENFAAQAESARSQVVAAGDRLLESFADKSRELGERLTHIGVEVANALSSRTARITESLNASMETVTEAITTKAEAVREVLSARLRAAEESIAQRGNEIADRIEDDSATLARRMTEAMQGFDNTVRVFGSGLADQMMRSSDVLNDHARSVLTSLDDRVSDKIRETTEAVDSRIQRIEQAIDARTQSLNETLANRTLELARTIADGSKVASEAVDKTVAGMGEYFATKAQEIAVTISDRAESVDQMLGKRALEMTENLDSHVRRFEDQVANKLVGITETIESRGVALTDMLVNKVDEVTKNLRTEAEEVERKLTQLGDGMTQTLVERMGDAIKTFAEQTVQIASTHDALRTNVIGSLEKLHESNALFRQLLQDVTDTLEPLESSMANRVNGLQTAIENTVSSTRTTVDWIDNQMHELRGIAGGVLRDLSALTQRFEGQGRFIASVAETLSETHGRIDQSLAERRQAIEQIVSMLIDRTAAIEENFGNRSQQIGERLAAFNHLLQEALEAAEARAHEIARHVADSTNQITHTINKQHEIIRNAYSEERGRTATALKLTYEEAIGDLRQMFSELQERFSDTAREVREVAQEVQSSLEQTRVELKRGVLELPHETRESAEAMRRVVADQIKALAELNEIVARYARGIELVEPRSANDEEAAAAIPRLAARGNSGPAAELPRVSRSTGPRDEPVDLRRARREPGDPRRTARDAGTRARADREAREEGERGGWLTELLSRAEHEDEGTRRELPSPLQAIESLDSLSVDIARMIDHDAAVELWDRYRRGERNVVTRRLYTAQGQKTFEEIRRRYRKSTEFRETVDRYIDEFERLLEQVSRDDRGQMLSKTYLTSDTGKVYTLLAHAAGRLN